MQTGDFDEAKSLCERSLALRGEETREGPPTLLVLAGALHAKGEFDAAMELARKALDRYKETVGVDHPDTAVAFQHLGLLYKESRYSLTTAQNRLERALDIRERAFPADHPLIAETSNHLGEVHRARGAYDRAAPLYARALAIYEKQLGPEHPTASTYPGEVARVDAAARARRLPRCRGRG